MKKVFLMGYNHTDSRLINIFPQIMQACGNAKCAVAVEYPADKSMEERTEFYKRKCSELHSTFDGSTLAKKISWQEVENLLDPKTDPSQVAKKLNDEENLHFGRLVFFLKNANVNLSLASSIVDSRCDYCCFDANAEVISGMKVGNAAAAALRHSIMTENLISYIKKNPECDYLLVITGAAHVPTLLKELLPIGVDVVRCGIELLNVQGKPVEDGEYTGVADLIKQQTLSVSSNPHSISAAPNNPKSQAPGEKNTSEEGEPGPKP